MNDGTQPPQPDGSPSRPVDWAFALAQNNRWLRTVVTARLGERQSVDEVLQEVSLAVLGTRADFEPSNLAGWLYRLAIRKTMLYRRSKGRHHKLTGRYAQKVRDEGASSSEPLGWLLLDERTSMVREALGRIPTRDAEVLILKYSENWSCRDLAEHLGLTESAIVSRLHRARGRLRDELARSNLIEVQP